MAKVFISYSRKDIDFAKRLTGELQTSGLDFWIDWEGIPPTVDWWREIEKGIEEADIFLFLISPDSSASKVCGQEIDHAVKNGKRLIPLVVRDVKSSDAPPALRPLNWVYARESDDFKAALEKLDTAIHTDYAWVQAHRQLQVKALEWEKTSKDKSFLLRGKELQDAEFQLATNTSKDPHPTDLQREYAFLSRQAADRQRRTTTILAAVVGVALLGLSVFSAFQAQSARDSQVTAEANLVVAQTAQADADANAATAVANEQEAKRQANIARSQVLMINANSDSLTVEKNLLLSIEAYNLVKGYPYKDRLLAEQALRGSLSNVGGIPLSGHEGYIGDLAFSPDGIWLATGSADNTARLWKVDDISAEPIILKGHEGPVNTLAFSPNGMWLATGSYDSTARLWNVASPLAKPIVLKGHEDSINTLAFSPDGMWLATGSYDSTVRLWNVTSPLAKPIVLKGHEDNITSLVFSPDGTWLATGSDDNSVRLWNVPNPSSEPIIWTGYQSAITTLDFSPDGNWLGLGGADTTQLLFVADLSVDPIVLKSDGSIYSLTFSPDGKWLVAGHADAIRLWFMADPSAQPVILKQYDNPVYSITISFSRGGELLAIGSSDGTIQLWEMWDFLREPIVLKGHDSAVYKIAFSPDGPWLATASYAGYTVRLWGINSIQSVENQLAENQLVESACQALGRNFTRAEWTQYFSNEEYRKTCEQWPLEPEPTAVP